MPSIEPFLRLITQHPMDADPLDVEPYVRIFEGMRTLVRSSNEIGPRIMIPSDRYIDEPLAAPAPPTTPSLPESPKVPMAPLPANLQQAVDAKIQAELKPVAEKLLRLQKAIDGFSLVSKADAERRVSNAVLIALGQDAVQEDPRLQTVQKELREALTIVGELVSLPFVDARKEVPPEPPPPTLQPHPALVEHAKDEAFWDELTKPEVPPVPTPVPALRTTMVENVPDSTPSKPAPSQPVVTQRRPKPTSEDDIAKARRLIAEVEALKLDIANQHPTRLEPLLHAMIAEVRMLMARIGPDQDYYLQKVTSLISLINALKNEGHVEGFIRGLAFGSTGDWERLSFKSRQKVTKYDNDVSRSEHSTGYAGKGKNKDKAPKPEDAPPSHKWPELPLLHALDKPILLAGGIVVPEKIKSIQERFGLNLEWHEIDHNNPRASQTLVSRIRSGKVGAIILLEGVMRHSTFRPVTEACTNNKVPYAMGDKAGIASLHAAFAELERQFAA
jgi:hypothetical protein